MGDKILTLKLTEDEVARLWDLLTTLLSRYTFKEPADLKAAKAIHDKVKVIAQKAGISKPKRSKPGYIDPQSA